MRAIDTCLKHVILMVSIGGAAPQRTRACVCWKAPKRFTIPCALYSIMMTSDFPCFRRLPFGLVFLTISAMLCLSFGQSVRGQGSSVAVGKPCSPANRWALLVFASESRLTGSETGKNDAIVAFQEMLIAAGFPEKQIIVLSTLADAKRQPTLKNIRDQLSWIRDADKPGPLPGQLAVRRNVDEVCECLRLSPDARFYGRREKCFSLSIGRSGATSYADVVGRS